MRLLSALILTFGLAVPTFGQNTGILAPVARFQFQNNNGVNCNGCKLYTYAAGTTDLLDTYSAPDTTDPGNVNPNPIVMSSSGRPQNGGSEIPIYLGAASYKFVLKTSADVTLWTQDNVSEYNIYEIEFNTKLLDKECLAAQWSGASGGAKIAACIAALPSTGGLIRTAGLQGAQTINQDLFTGITKPVHLILGAGATWSMTVQQNTSADLWIELEAGTTLNLAAPISNTANKLMVTGAGPTSTINLNGTNATGIQISRDPGTDYTQFRLANFRMVDSSSVGSTAMIHLDGVSVGKLENLWLFGQSKADVGVYFDGSQQIEFSCCLIQQTDIGIKLEDSQQMGGAWVAPNFNEIHGVAVAQDQNKIGIQTVVNSLGAEIAMHDNHITTGDSGSLGGTCAQLDGASGTFLNNHIEYCDVGVTATGSGTLKILSNWFTQNGVNVELVGASGSMIFGNLLSPNGPVSGTQSIDVTSVGVQFGGNYCPTGCGLTDSSTSTIFTPNVTASYSFGTPQSYEKFQTARLGAFNTGGTVQPLQVNGAPLDTGICIQTNGGDCLTLTTESATDEGLVLLNANGTKILKITVDGKVQLYDTSIGGVAGGWDKTDAGAPSAGDCGAGNIGSTYRRTDGGPGSSFYVCENAGAPAWAAK